MRLRLSLSVLVSASRVFEARLVQRDFFLGTFAPFLRASESPMAIACFLLLTLPPLPRFPDFRVPCFLRLIALATVFFAVRPYLAILSPLFSCALRLI